MNPYFYLFYKLNRFLNKKGNNIWGVIYAITSLIGWNIVFLYIKILGIKQENSQGIYKTILIGIAILLFITNWILFIDKQRVTKIMNRYKRESIRHSKIGNTLVLLYVLLSLCLIVFI